MDSESLKQIRNYLDSTNSKGILSKPVIIELREHYAKRIQEKVNNYNSAYKELPEIITGISGPINLEKRTVTEYVDNKLIIAVANFGIDLQETPNYNSDVLDELVSRACKRTPPFNKNGQNFRDSLIWMSILNYAKQNDFKSELAVITKDGDFTLPKEENRKQEPQKLFHPDLIEEALSLGLTIRYFDNLESFILDVVAKNENQQVSEELIRNEILLFDISGHISKYLIENDPEFIQIQNAGNNTSLDFQDKNKLQYFKVDQIEIEILEIGDLPSEMKIIDFAATFRVHIREYLPGNPFRTIATTRDRIIKASSGKVFHHVFEGGCESSCYFDISSKKIKDITIHDVYFL